MPEIASLLIGDAPEVWSDLGFVVDGGASHISGVAHALGTKWKYASSEDVFNEIAESIDDFKGMTYMRLGTRGAKLNSVKSNAELTQA